MPDIREQFEKLKTRNQNLEKEMAVIQDRKKNLEKELQEINLKLEGMCVDSKDLNGVIVKLESELENEILIYSNKMMEAESKLAVAKSVLS